MKPISETILPCMCGKSAFVCRDERKDKEGKYYLVWQITCTDCARHTKEYTEKTKAIKAWNEGDLYE